MSQRSYESYLEELSQRKKEVFFVEIGAADGKSFDPLYKFASKHSWSGLLIEPHPELFLRLRETYCGHRTLIFENVAISDKVEDRDLNCVAFDAIDGDKIPNWALGISSLYDDRNAIGGQRVLQEEYSAISQHKKKIKVSCVPLSLLVEKHSIRNVDVIQIDTEGHDYHVLRQIDFSRLKPELINFESCNLPDSELQSALKLLGQNGYYCLRYPYDVLAVKAETFFAPRVFPREQSKRLRIAFYTEPRWAFGSIHSELCGRLVDFGIDAKILDFTRHYDISEFREEVLSYDYVVTDPGASLELTTSYGIPKGRIVLISHGEPDILHLFNKSGRSEFDAFRDFAVVSESLYSSVLTLGLRPPSAVLRMGVNCDKYSSDVSSELKTVGYAAILSRKNAFGVEIKRGELARNCAFAAGLEFSPAEGIPYQEMPAYYRSVDAIIMPSLQEGASLPALEAAAAGRLVIGSPVGHFPRCAYQGTGILAPLVEDEFFNFVVEKLKFFKENSDKYREKCRQIQAASRTFDWSCVISMWAKFLWKQQNPLN